MATPRNRRQHRGHGRPASPPRRIQSPNSRSARRRLSPTWLIGGAIAVVAVVVVGFAVFSTIDTSPGGSSANLRLVAYQGFERIGGERTDLKAVLGQGTPVVLNFFAGQCPPCRGEMPGFENVWRRNQGDVLILGADIGPFLNLGSHADAERLLRDLGITYPAAYVENNPVNTFGIVAMPTTVFYDASGRQVGRHTGFLPEAQLEAVVQSLIASVSK